MRGGGGREGGKRGGGEGGRGGGGRGRGREKVRINVPKNQLSGRFLTIGMDFNNDGTVL